MKREKLIYKSHNGEHNVTAWLIYNEDIAIKGIVQVAHGMKEHFLRYSEFTEFLANSGYAVCGNDHVGHGDSLCGEQGSMGYGDVCETIVNDMHALFKIVKGRFPKAPYYLLGHSLGGFASMVYASGWAYELNGLILSGVGDYSLVQLIMYKCLYWVCNIAIALFGPNKKIALIDSLFFGSFLKYFKPIKTKADWQNSDENMRNIFLADPKVDFYFPLGGYKGVMRAIETVSSKKWAKSLPKTLPVLIFSGGDDPVVYFGKGAKLLCNRLIEAGVNDVSLSLYEGGRHEMLFETDREEVYRDIAGWLNNR